MSYPYLYSAAGPLAPLVGAALLTNLLFQNRETILNFIHNLKEGNFCKTPEEKQVLEQLQKYFQDLDIGIDKIIHIGHAGSIQAKDIFMSQLRRGYGNDDGAQIITILDVHGNETVFLISSNPNIPIRQLTADDGILRYKISQEDIDAQKLANEIFEQQKIDVKNAQKQAEINKVLAQVEKKQPSDEKYNKLPCHDHLLPVDGPGRIFIPAYSKDGRILRDSKGAYFDIEGNKWVLNEEKQKWEVSVFAYGSTTFINFRDQNPLSNPPIIDTSSDSINNDQNNSLTDTDEEVDNPHINQAKNNNTKKPKQNNKNNKPEDQDPKDPKDPKKPDDKYTYKNGKIDDYEKHHKNSPKNVGKPPRDPQKALDDSFDVEGSDQRVSVQDKKIIIFKQSAPGLYHGYIIENYQLLEPFIKQALFAAGLIKNIKTGKLA